jgi:hypothetical protein
MEATSSTGIGIPGLLTIVFITLKLTGYIMWSWWWVLSPLWIPFAIFCGVLAAILIFLIIAAVFVLIIGIAAQLVD